MKNQLENDSFAKTEENVKKSNDDEAVDETQDEGSYAKKKTIFL